MVTVFDNSWRTFAVRTAVFCAAVFGAMRLAVARDGVAGGPARSFVTVAGTLTGVSGATPATFEFRRAGSPALLCAPQVTITPGAGGAFSVPVPLDQPELSATARCPDDLLDGRDVQVRVLVGGNEVATWAPINPVPYAHFATSAGRANIANSATSADRLAVGPRFIWDRLDTPFQWLRPDGGADVDIPVPGLSLRLPTAGAYLLIFNARFFGTAYGDAGRDDLNTVALVVRGRSIARQSLPGYLGEVGRQRTASVTIVAPYVAAAAGDEVTVLVLAAPGVRSLEFAASPTGDDGARLIAIPMVEGL